jgi:hypothetical protein
MQYVKIIMLLYLYKNIYMNNPQARLFSTRRKRKSTVLASHSRVVLANREKEEKKVNEENLFELNRYKKQNSSSSSMKNGQSDQYTYT